MSINHRTFSEVLHSPRIPVKEIALKEWDVVIDAIEQGDQILLVRKGGIVEETKEFRLEDTSFYLYPTYLHQNPELVREPYSARVDPSDQGALQPEQVDLRLLAHVTDDIELNDEHALKKLLDYHILTEDYANRRLRWKKGKPLHILIIRAYRLSQAISVPVLEQYQGCKSWITLQKRIQGVDCIPVLEDERFHKMRMEVLKRLGLLKD
jgi:hypothetical protein